ncbi:alpha/beta hydrolase [Oerskovia flava]|uniref:alpha/beta hydrolase n=1 Tax=Oerskovia flava TaxID=2986422 RepID=UPI0022407304|nr:alpha/beta hydrolase [Oerskovia sp. JB1-3-2]
MTEEPTTPWRTDVLGEDWVARPLALPAGAVATLVRRRVPDVGQDPLAGAPAVLYVHGFVDYFFQMHVAEAFESRGYRFYAVDLRGYGRSIGQGSREALGSPDDGPNYVTDLGVYAQDLDAAVRAIRAEGHDDVVLLGHSTGGLIASLWTDARPGQVRALVLNSPWFDLNENWFTRVPGTWVLDALGRIAPRLVVGSLDPHWGRALHAQTGGEWDYDLAWKPHEGFPARAGWFRTIRRAHARIARGLDIDCPVLVLTSDRSGPSKHWHRDLLTTDSVLDVEHIRARAPGLGHDVTLATVDGGAHDLALSPEPARSRYLAEVLDWLARRGVQGVAESPARG